MVTTEYCAKAGIYGKKLEKIIYRLLFGKLLRFLSLLLNHFQVDICLQHSEMDTLFHLVDKDQSSSIDSQVVSALAIA